MLFAVVLAVLSSAVGLPIVSAAGPFMYTHPEICFPLTSGLIQTAKPIPISLNVSQSTTTTSGYFRRKRQTSASSFPNTFTDTSALASEILTEAGDLFGPLSSTDDQFIQSVITDGSQLLESLRQGGELPPPTSNPASGSSFTSSLGSSFGSSSFQYYLYPCGSLVNLMFRTADGGCNHFFDYGQSLKPMTRILFPDYNDGFGEPRRLSVTGPPLPSPRTVSRQVHVDLVASTDLTVLVMLWGQFMDHDMVSTPLPIEDPQDNVPCCGPDGTPPTGQTDSECFPLLFPPGDPDFLGTCMEFVRSAPVTNSFGTILFPRENKNALTAFIDASTVYGSTQEEQDELRDPSNRHLLRTTADNFPPDSGLDDCVKRDANDICFLAGDDRVNENPGLTLLHTVFLRYHNYLATQLDGVSPFASRELIFQQARAIVGAVMQNILYADWLPIVLGPSIRSQYQLDLTPGVRTRYDNFQDPRIFQAFSTAAFRFGHSLIPRSLLMSPGRRVPLRQLFFAPYEARENLDTLAEGLLQAADSEDRSQPFDRHLVEEVTGHLFENQEGTGRGFDLAALNIHRGRDHALPSYNDFRVKLGLGRVTSFSHPALGTSGSVLSNTYAHVDDIDLFTGGYSEPAFDGGLVGETFSHLIARQFRSLKFGDRFFFDSDRFFIHGFTGVQVGLLRGIHLSHVLCLTTGVNLVQQNVFRVADAGNPTESCSILQAQHPSMANFKDYPFF